MPNSFLWFLITGSVLLLLLCVVPVTAAAVTVVMVISTVLFVMMMLATIDMLLCSPATNGMLLVSIISVTIVLGLSGTMLFIMRFVRRFLFGACCLLLRLLWHYRS